MWLYRMLQLICGSQRWLWVGNCPRKPLRRCIHWARLVIRSLLWLVTSCRGSVHMTYPILYKGIAVSFYPILLVQHLEYLKKEGVKFTCCDLRLLCVCFQVLLHIYFSFYCHISLEAAFDQSTVNWTCVGFSTFISSGLHLHFQFFCTVGKRNK